MNFNLNTKINLSNKNQSVKASVNKINYQLTQSTYTSNQTEVNYEDYEPIETNQEEAQKITEEELKTTFLNAQNDIMGFATDIISNLWSSGKTGSTNATETESGSVSFEEGYRKGLQQNRDDVSSVFEGNEAASNVAMAAGGFANGAGNVIENGVDGAVTVGTAFLTPFTMAYDAITGSHVTEDMHNAAGAFVEEEHVNNAFEYLYTETELGQTINENASETMQYGHEGYNTAVGAGYLTGTVVGASALSFVSPLGMTSSGAIISGVAGTGRGTSDALNNGANMQQATVAGIATGAWEGGQWVFGARISGNGLTTIALDSASGAVDPVVRSGIQTIYNGQSFATNFEQNGGLTGMATNAFVAGSFSTIGEIPTFRQKAKSSSTISPEPENINVEMTSPDTFTKTNANGENINLDIRSFDNRPRVSEIEMQETQAKIQDLKTSLRNQGILNDNNEIIFDSLLKNLNDGIQIDPTFKSLLLNLDSVMEQFPNLKITIDNGSFGAAYNSIYSTLRVGDEMLIHSSGARSSFASLHELGHTLFNNFRGTNQTLDTPIGAIEYIQAPPSDKITTLVKNAQDQINNNSAQVTNLIESNDKIFHEAQAEATRRYSLIEESETTRLNNQIDDLLQSNETVQLKKLLRDAGIDGSEIDSILQNPEQLKEIVNSNYKQLSISVITNDIASLDNGSLGEMQLDSMLNSVTQSETFGDIHFKQFHPDNYWIRKGSIDGACRDSYDELMADYFAIMSSGRGDLIDEFADVSGSELTDALYEEYSSILEELESNGAIRR